MNRESSILRLKLTLKSFCNSLAGMIVIGLVVGLVLCTPFFIYWRQNNPATENAPSRPADLQPQAALARTAPEARPSQASEKMPGKVGQLAKVHGQFDPTYGPQPGDVAVIGQPLALTTGPFQVQVVFCGAAYDESIEILAPFMKPREFDGHLERSPSMQLSQARRYLVQAGTEARVIEKAGALYGAIEGHERRNPIFKVQIAEGPLQGKQLYCLGLCLQREPEGDALPWTFEEERTHTLAVLEEDNPEYVLAQYRSAYMMSRGKNLNFLAAKLQGHGLTPPNAEREAFQKSRRAGTEESIPKQTTTEATHNSKGSPPQNDDGTRDRPEKSALTLELLEDNGKHTKRGGLLPIYEVNAWVRNTSVQPPKHVAF